MVCKLVTVLTIDTALELQGVLHPAMNASSELSSTRYLYRMRALLEMKKTERQVGDGPFDLNGGKRIEREKRLIGS